MIEVGQISFGIWLRLLARILLHFSFIVHLIDDSMRTGYHIILLETRIIFLAKVRMNVFIIYI